MFVVVATLGTIPKWLVKELEDLERRGDHPDNTIIKIGQNTEKSSAGLRRLAVTQTPVKDHQRSYWRSSSQL